MYGRVGQLSSERRQELATRRANGVRKRGESMSTKKQDVCEAANAVAKGDACPAATTSSDHARRSQPSTVVEVELHNGAVHEMCGLLPTWVGCVGRQPTIRRWCSTILGCVQRADLVQPCGVLPTSQGSCRTIHTDVEIAMLLYPSVTNELSLSLTDMDRNVLILKRIAGRAYRHLFGFVDYDDLLQFAWLGLLEARSRFEAIAGVPFGAYAHRRVKGAIIDGMARMTGMSRGRLRTIRNAVDPEGNALLETDSAPSSVPKRMPSGPPLRPPPNVTTARILQPDGDVEKKPTPAEDDRSWLLRAYETPASWDKLCDHAAETSQLPLYGKPPACPEELAIRGQLLDRLWDVYRLMDQDDQDLLRALYYDEISTRELGERFQVSSASISRRHLRIINHLRRCVGHPTRRTPCARRRRRPFHGA